MNTPLVLISSYPKSGNTWTRVVFTHVLKGSSDAVLINDMGIAFHGSGRRRMFDSLSPVTSSDLHLEEVENLLPEVFRALAEEMESEVLIKVHECSHRNQQGEWIFPPEDVRAAICLVRHPFDVAVSLANHMGREVNAAIEIMSSSLIVPNEPGSLGLPLPHVQGTWSENVESWLFRSPYRTAMARYEDLIDNPVPEFHRLLLAADISATIASVEAAVAASRFERLQEQEREFGFRERPKTSPSFFRAGRAMSWEGLLDEEARARIVRDHGAMMKRLGYLEDGSTAPLPDDLHR